MSDPVNNGNFLRFVQEYGISVDNLIFGEGNFLAYTDGDIVKINPNNHITESFVPLLIKYLSIIGLKGHELGHILFTDFEENKKYFQALKECEFYPEKPVHKNADEMKKALSNKAFLSIAKSVENILEDRYVEFKIHTNKELSYYFSEALILNNLRMEDLAPSSNKEFANSKSPLIPLINALLCYCNSENFMQEIPATFSELFEKMKEVVDRCAFEDDIKIRLCGANELLCLLFPYIQEYISITENTSSDDDKAGQKLLEDLGLSDNESHCAEGGEKGDPKKLISESTRKKILEAASGEASTAPPDKKRDEMRRAVENAKKNLSQGNYGELLLKGSKENPKAKEAASRVFSDLPKNKANLKEIQDMKKLRDEFEVYNRNKGYLHAGIPLVLHRDMDEHAKKFMSSYKDIQKRISPYAKQLANLLSERIKEIQSVGTKYSVFGRKIVASRLYRDDKDFFSDKKDIEVPGLSICLLIDLSGSMSFFGRIGAARLAAATLYDFVKIVPSMEIGIYGFNTVCSDKSVTGEATNLSVISNFDYENSLDGGRLAAMDASSNNRDGHAIAVCCEKLISRNFKNKLFILISDGAPCAWDYCYCDQVCKELSGLKKKYQNKGVKFITAAIGDDKEAIKKIYGAESFLDIKNLKALPRKLLNICVEMMDNV